MKIYTRSGDDGTTQIGPNRMRKCDCLVEIQGNIDELQAAVDALYVVPNATLPCPEKFIKIQEKLWQMAGELALGVDMGSITDPITSEDTQWLEKKIDSYKLKLRNFIRFRYPLSVALNECRVRTRRVERQLTARADVRPEVLQFINRLSDFFFAFAAKYEAELTVKETPHGS